MGTAGREPGEDDQHHRHVMCNRFFLQHARIAELGAATPTDLLESMCGLSRSKLALCRQ